MKSQNSPRALARLLVIVGAGLLGWLFQCGGTWLVHHDNAYYRVSDVGFGFIANLAEGLFFVGPILSILVGMILGTMLVLVIEHRHGSSHA